MDDQMRNDEADKVVDEVMLPGFRFHPTDEELVGFYLKRKIQHRPLSIELIKQLDIYKYDPWDLPKVATTGEKEWYFYCPRDRKYRNSARPNRVTGTGFWKATGTDRPIYSSEGSKCIGLKKSLVFYKGRAAKGIKTDWMMHEFRLPSLTDSAPPKRFLDKNNMIPANDLWAICRIFKKANSNAQRALSNSWVSPVFPDSTTIMTSDHTLTPQFHSAAATTATTAISDQFSSDITRPISSLIHYASCSNYINDLHNSSITSLSPHFDLPPYKPYNQIMPSSAYTFLSPETTSTDTTKCSIDNSNSLLFSKSSSSIFGDFDKASFESLDHYKGIQDQLIMNNGFLMNLPQQDVANIIVGEASSVGLMKEQCSNVTFFDDQWGMNIRPSSHHVGFPYTSLPMAEAWRLNLLRDSSSPCPSDQMSTSYSTNKCNTS